MRANRTCPYCKHNISFYIKENRIGGVRCPACGYEYKDGKLVKSSNIENIRTVKRVIKAMREIGFASSLSDENYILSVAEKMKEIK